MKLIKYFFQFIFIIIFFFLFKILGYKLASNLGSIIGKYLGKFLRGDKIILKNVSIMDKYLNIKPNDQQNFVNEIFSNYGRILSDYVFLKQFRNGPLKKYVNVIGENVRKTV